MEPVTAFFIGLTILMLFTAGVLVCVQRPLTAILEELCGAEHRARFWIRLYDATLVLLVLFFAIWSPPTRGTEVSFHDFLGMFRAGTFGLLCGVGVLGFFVLVFISRYESDRNRLAAQSKDYSSTA